MNVFLCVIAASGKDPVSEVQRAAARDQVRKRYPPCYADTTFTIFRCADALGVVGDVVASICKQHGVGAVVVPVEPSKLVAHDVDAGKCFGDVNAYSASYVVR